MARPAPSFRTRRELLNPPSLTPSPCCRQATRSLKAPPETRAASSCALPRCARITDRPNDPSARTHAAPCGRAITSATTLEPPDDAVPTALVCQPQPATSPSDPGAGVDAAPPDQVRQPSEVARAWPPPLRGHRERHSNDGEPVGHPFAGRTGLLREIDADHGDGISRSSQRRGFLEHPAVSGDRIEHEHDDRAHRIGPVCTTQIRRHRGGTRVPTQGRCGGR
jgi:hypothetical protein